MGESRGILCGGCFELGGRERVKEAWKWVDIELTLEEFGSERVSGAASAL